MRWSLLCSMLLLSSNLLAAGLQCLSVFEGGTLEKAGKSFENSPLITIISGTNRRGSESLKVALKTKEVLESKGARVRILDLVEVPMDVFSPDNYFGKTPSHFKEKFEAPISEADALLVVIPAYNEAMPGILKMFFDYSQASLAGKPVAAIGVSAGQWGARNPVAEFTELMSHMKATMIGGGRLNIPNVENAKSDPEILKRLDAVTDVVFKTANVMNEKVKLLAKAKSEVRVAFDSGAVVEGKLSEVINSRGQVAYLRFEGPTQILADGKVIEGQGKDRHASGFGMPVGVAQFVWNPASKRYSVKFDSGVEIDGIWVWKKDVSDKNNNLMLVTFTDCTVKLGDKILFDPSWGEFDLVLARSIRAADVL